MSSLSHASRFVPAGSQLAAELSRLLRGIGYTIQGAADVVDHVDQLGTARDSAADVEDVATINDLVVKHFASVEADPADWPAAFDEDVWALTSVEPPVGPLPPAEAFGGDYEPSFEERRAWAEIHDREERIDSALDRAADEAAALEMLTRGLTYFPRPVSGGAPEPHPIPGRSHYTISLEGRRNVLRLDGRAVYQSTDYDDVRDELARRTEPRHHGGAV